MFKKVLLLSALLVLFNVAFCQESYATIAAQVIFRVQTASGQKFTLSLSNLQAFYAACPLGTPYNYILHGWRESFASEWVPGVIDNTLKFAGGCAIFMDYSYWNYDYTLLTNRYISLRDLFLNIIKTLKNEENIHIFAFSFGARIAIGAGKILTEQNNNVPKIQRMDLCDPARPNFNKGETNYVASNTSAKLVVCIHNTIDLGTNRYECHQNFKMGHCGIWQDGRGDYPKGSHGLCPFFYRESFIHDFKYNEIFKGECSYEYSQIHRAINETCKQGIILGRRNKMLCHGDILIPTAKCPPYVYNGVINNYPPGKSTC